MLGVRSGIDKWKPYVADRNSHEAPVIMNDSHRNPLMHPKREAARFMPTTTLLTFFSLFRTA